MKNLKRLSVCATALAASWSTGALAQDDTQSLMALSVSALRQEIQTRYDAGLAASTDPAIVSVNDNRFMWANEAKAQCGIALGFLKSSTKDETSVGKCALAARMMNRVSMPPVVQAPIPMPQPDPVCKRDVTGLIFFDFDSSALPASANDSVSFVTQNAVRCQWTSITVVGHTDRSGSDAYNESLALRRANTVAEFLRNGGIAPSMLKVEARGESQPLEPTADGVRNPQNRRVEIIAN